MREAGSERPLAGAHERRAFERHPTELLAEIVRGADTPLACAIRDWCRGGLLVTVSAGPSELPRQGAEVAIRSPAGGGRAVEFRARVAHVDGSHFGLAFIAPAPAALRGLETLADQAARAAAPIPPPTAAAESSTRAGVLEDCSALARASLAPMITRFLDLADEDLMAVAEKEHDLRQMNAFFEAPRVLKNAREHLQSAFAEAVEERLQRVGRGSAAAHSAAREVFSGDLSLVEEQELNTWLAIGDICTGVNSDNKEVLGRLEPRLSLLLQEQVDDASNPYGPLLFAECFVEALGRVGLEHSATLVCYKTFKKALLPLAREFYQKLEKLLIDAGVLPDLKYGLGRGAGEPTPEPDEAAAEMPDAESQAVASARAGRRGEGGGGAGSPRRPGGGAAPAAGGVPDGATADGAGHASGARGVAPGGGADGIASAPVPGAALDGGSHAELGGAAGGTTPRAAPNLYQVTADLHTLQSTFSQGWRASGAASAPQSSGGGAAGGATAAGPQAAVAGGAARPAPVGVPAAGTGPTGAAPAQGGATGQAQQAAGNAAAAPAGGSATTGELVEVLANQPMHAYSAEAGSLREYVQSVLAARSPEGASKRIGPREGRVIDVTGDVFASLLDDPQLAPDMRPWLQRLEVPVLRAALLDEGVFAEGDHIVRGLLNKVAELELLAAEDVRQRGSIRRALEWLLTTLNKEFDGTVDVFRRVAAQLDILLRVQRDTFEQNVRQTVAEVAREEETLPAPAQEEAASPASDDPWLRRVRRLQEGHWVLFDMEGDEPQRLKVAWVAPRTGRYVFVNALGKQARIESAEPLAELLRAGQALLLDDAEAPAMDRAQFGMLQKLHRQLLHQAAHDQVTGLINRREFEQRLDEALTDAKVSDVKHVLCFIGVDQFKMVTGSGGYDAGDELMRQLAERLEANVAEHGVLARLESDAFGMLLCRHSIDDALAVIEEQMDELQDYRFGWEEERISVSLSVGLATLTPRSEDRTTLLQAAASSCAQAGEMGGGRVQVYYSQSGRVSRRRQEMHWAARIDKALDEDGLYLRCQKILPLDQHRNLQPHYEVLLGLSEELGGEGELGTFVRAAESNGRMADVDRWVIRNAFEWLGAHQDYLLGIESFSINLSGVSLNGEGVVDFISEELQRTGAPVEKICFEITETAGISNLSDAADFIRAVKAFGCRFSLDDFGSGMSSYAYLKNLPVDYLKIDGVFIRDIANDSDDYAMAKSICEIGHFLGKAVVAEYVHDAATYDVVSELGADFAQGFGVERPHRLADLLEL